MSCRIGVDMPVILRTSDGTESDLPTPERHMIQVTNPFRLEIGFGSASVSGKKTVLVLTRFDQRVILNVLKKNCIHAIHSLIGSI